MSSARLERAFGARVWSARLERTFGAHASCVRDAGILPAIGVRRRSEASTAHWMIGNGKRIHRPEGAK